MARRARRRSGPKLLLADPDTRERYINAICNGVPLSYAAAQAGVDAATVGGQCVGPKMLTRSWRPGSH